MIPLIFTKTVTNKIINILHIIRDYLTKKYFFNCLWFKFNIKRFKTINNYVKFLKSMSLVRKIIL